MGELLSCPFCGGEPFRTTGLGEHWVSCSECKASAAMSGHEELAAMAWNTRFQSPRTMALEEAAKWHDEQERLFRQRAIASYTPPGPLPDVGDTLDQIADWHRDSADAIRALASGSGHRNSVNTSALVDQSDQNLDEARS